MTAGRRCSCCFIVPPHLLRSLASGQRVAGAEPAMVADTLALTQTLSAARPSGGAVPDAATLPPDVVISPADLALSPIHLFDCGNVAKLPGTPIATIAAGGDAAASVAATTADVVRFYQEVLGRNAIDGAGGPVISALNYGPNFLNAYWSGQVMVYGTGDQHIFTDFWRAPDVICHEITHGITQHESKLVYEGEAGALNESLSDCFAAAFNQWRLKTSAADPSGWRLGTDLLGPAAKINFGCLRDMANPTGPYCLTPQPSLYANMLDDDVHRNSGIPNRAFALFAKAVGGNTFEAPIKLWYAAATRQGLSSSATMADFAAATLRAAASVAGGALTTALAAAWKTVMVTPTP